MGGATISGMSNEPPADQVEGDRFLSPAQVAEMIPGLSVRSLRQMRADGKGPRYFKPAPRTVIYVEADVRAWMRTTLHTTRDQS